MLDKKELSLLIKTLPGLETVLAREVKKLGGRQVREGKRAVMARGDVGFVYKANLWLRTALRVLVQLAQWKVQDQEDLYRKVKMLPWEDFFDAQKSIAIDATVFSDRFPNSLFVAQRCKDAIVDRFRDKGHERPNVDLQDPDIRINVHLNTQHQCSLSLDSSGASLHKRNYRREVDRAPLNEVLAAGLIGLSGWDGKTPFIDPMCGSGTLLIEAALIAGNIPPNVFRKKFCFQNWRNYDAELYELIFDKSLEKETPFTTPIIGMDIDIRVLNKARQNSRRALMDEQIQLHKADFLSLPPELHLPEGATLLWNPPYDHKMESNIPELYSGMGDTLKQHFTGSDAWIFSASQEGIKSIGLRSAKKIKLNNAQLDAWLLHYPLYSGKRKENIS